MEIWSGWVNLLSNGVGLFSFYFGLSEAMAIIVLTLCLRLLILPLSLKATLQSYKNKSAMDKLKPKLERLKQRYHDNPSELAKQTIALYKQSGVRFLDKVTLGNIGAQAVVGLGMFQALKNMLFKSSFLWIANIAKPDIVLAVIVGVLTFITLLLMPSAIEQQNHLFFLIPAFMSAFVLISFPSAIALYWLCSSLVSLLQSLLVKAYLSRSAHLTY